MKDVLSGKVSIWEKVILVISVAEPGAISTICNSWKATRKAAEAVGVSLRKMAAV